MSTLKPYIFRTQPYLSSKVWGGRNLATNWGKKLPAEGVFGEAWEVADLEQGQSRLANGPLAGTTLQEVVLKWGYALCGNNCPDHIFPLLIKILDAHHDLSIQVHPGSDDLSCLPVGSASKDECWIVLNVAENGHILHGFNCSLTFDEIRDAVRQGSIINYMKRVDVRPGDIIRVSPGTVHAICKGVTLLEVQQPSDTTFRLFDYDRPGFDGKPRALHLDDALKVLRASPSDAEQRINFFQVVRSHEPYVLMDVDAYRIEGMRVVDPMKWAIDPGSVQVVFIMSGQCELIGSDNQRVILERGQTAVIPACTGQVQLVKCGQCPFVEVIVAGLGGHTLIESKEHNFIARKTTTSRVPVVQ